MTSVESARTHGAAGHRTFAIRPAHESDAGYICNSWVKSVLDGHRVFARADDVRELNADINRLLDDSATKILVACETHDAERIIGWVAYASVKGARTLMYLLVRHSERRKGIAGELIRSAGLGVNGSPLLFMYDGPSSGVMLAKRPDAKKIEPKDYFA